VRTELLTPKRPRILGRSKTVVLEPALKARLSLVLLVAALVIGGVATNLWRQSGILEKQGSQKAERAKTSKAILQPPSAPEPIPTPVPAPNLPPDRDWQPHLAVRQITALVKLPPPRAQLISLEKWAKRGP